MSTLNTYNQAPTDVRRYQLDYSRWLDSAIFEILNGVVVDIVVLNSDTEVVPLLLVDITETLNDNTRIQYVVSEGTSGVRYRVDFTATTHNSLGTPVISTESIIFRIT